MASFGVGTGRAPVELLGARPEREGLGERVARLGRGRGPAAVVDGFVEQVGQVRRRQGVVLGDGGQQIGVLGQPRHQGPADGRVPPGAFGRGQVGVHGLAGQRVDEAERAGLPRLLDEPGPDGVVEVVEDHAVAGGLEQRGVEVAPDHRSHRQGALGALRQRQHTEPEHVGDPGRYVEALGVRGGDSPAGGEQPRHLEGEERVAVAAAGEHVDQLGTGCVEDPVEQRRDAVVVERPHLDPAYLQPRQVGQGLAELGVAARVDGPHRRHQQDRVTGELCGDMAEQLQRGVIGPVQVLERDHQRLPRRSQQLRHGGERPQRRRGRRAGAIGVLTDHPGGLAEQCGDLGRVVGTRGERPDHREPGPVRRGEIGLVAAPLQHQDSPRLRASDQLCGQQALPDPRVAGDQDDAAVPPRGQVVEGVVEGGQRLGSPDHRLPGGQDVVRFRPRAGEVGVLGEHLRLEPAYGGRWVEPELLDEVVAEPAQRLE